jgi:hypothetical protein
MHTRRIPLSAAVVAIVVLLVSLPAAQSKGTITSPKEQFGFNIGDDYQLANYAQLVEHWTKLSRESDRMKLVDIGRTSEGRTHVMAIITSPANHKMLDRYRDTARRLALAEGLTDEQARALAAEGKAVVWIDGGLHATEVLGSQQLMETVYQMVSRTDAETLRFLNDVILLAVPANPDGQDLVANWYMRNPDPTKRSTSQLPRLYNKYAGHDNNRDAFMMNLAETTNMNRVLYHEWFPQIMYNHHQSGPAGAVLFAPPFRDPFNYSLDPLVPIGIDRVASAMHERFLVENKPGATMRSGANYSTWWNGGMRTAVYFHNMIGLLTESIGNPTPIDLPLVPQFQLPKGDLPYPAVPQKWYFRQSIAYSITANRAVLDYASKQREDLLFNIYRMAKNSIERGSRDHWTIHPSRIEALVAASKQTPRDGRETPAADGAGASDEGGGNRNTRGLPLALYKQVLQDPAYRDPRGYVIPSSQPDFSTATKFVNILMKAGVVVHRATAPFDVGGKRYPAGSYVVKTAQAFRPYVLDLFEPQDHPNDFTYPGGPPRRPYDSAGWTLAMLMGVQFDRSLEGFDGPFEKLAGPVKPPAGRITGSQPATGYLLSHDANDSALAVNRLLKAGEDVFWLKQSITANGNAYGAGTIYIAARPSTAPILQRLAADVGVTFDAVTTRPAGEHVKLRQPRVALWDRYGGSMPSGWTRWLFEQFEFPYDVVFASALDAGNLASKYDVLVLVGGAVPERDAAPSGRGNGAGTVGAANATGRGAPPAGVAQGSSPADAGATNTPRDANESIPAEYHHQLANVTVSKTVPQLRRFVEDGGTIVTIGSSTTLAYHFGLPVTNALVEKGPDGRERSLPNDKYYIPGSILRVAVDTTHPLAYGTDSNVDVFFDNSPVFRLRPDAALRGVRPVAWFPNATPLRSGWAWGQDYLKDGVAIVEANVGKGKVYLIGPEVTFRAQPHGTFKFLFNGIHASAASAPVAGWATGGQ